MVAVWKSLSCATNGSKTTRARASHLDVQCPNRGCAVASRKSGSGKFLDSPGRVVAISETAQRASVGVSIEPAPDRATRDSTGFYLTVTRAIFVPSAHIVDIRSFR